MCRPFDKGNQDLHTFISKQIASRSILLCFNFHHFKLSTVCNPLHQLDRFYDFEFKSTTLIRDLQLHFNIIKISKTFSTIIASSSEFLISSFFGTFFGRDFVSSVLYFSYVLGIACVAHATILCSNEFWTHVCYSLI